MLFSTSTRAAIALATAARLGFAAAQDPADPLLIPPAPAASEETAPDETAESTADDEAAGPLLVPPAPFADAPTETDSSPRETDSPEEIPPLEEVPSPEEAIDVIPEASRTEPPLLRSEAADDVEPARSEPLDSPSTIIRQRQTRFRPVVPPPRPTPVTNFPDASPPAASFPEASSSDASPPGESPRPAASTPLDEETRLDELDEETRARYRFAGGEWWFQLRSGRWKYHRDGEWRDFDPATFVPIATAEPFRNRTDIQPAGGYGPRPYRTLRPTYPPDGRLDGRGEREDAPSELRPGDLPPGLYAVPADAVDLRFRDEVDPRDEYGPGDEWTDPAFDERDRDRRRGPVRSFFRGIFRR